MEVLRAGQSEIIDDINGTAILKKLERIARVCYNSEDKITANSAAPFIRGLIKAGHESVIEHVSITVKLITDRAVTHELVRHRLASYTQRSQRYVSEGSLVVIEPEQLTEEGRQAWKEACELSEAAYNYLLAAGNKRETARSVLPNCTATTIYITANLREWRWIFLKRTAKDAHPDMQALMVPLLLKFQTLIPVIFDDINTENVSRWQ